MSLPNFLEPLIKLFLIQSNKDKCKVAHKILNENKQNSLTTLNMHSKVLNNLESVS